MRVGSVLTTLMLVALCATSNAARAAPCAGFPDVDDTLVGAAFCQNVEWIKNRGVTLGCTSPTLYCPDAAVNRLAMAAFMNRLATALTPVQIRVDLSSSTVDLDPGIVICQSGDFAIVNFPRRAYVDLSLSALAPADVTLAADLAYSIDAGVTWTNLNTIANRVSVVANHWGALSDIGYVDLNVGQNARFGVRMTRGGVSGTVDLDDTRCQLRSLIHSRSGATSPL